MSVCKQIKLTYLYCKPPAVINMAESSPPSIEVLRTFEKVPNNYLILSPDLYIITASDQYLEATETKREVIAGKHIFEAFPNNPDWPEADGVQNINDSLQQVLRTKKPHKMAVQKYDVPDINNPGKFIPKYWLPSHTPILDDDGEISYIIQLANNVTGQVLTEKQLQETSRKEGVATTKNTELEETRLRLESTISELAESEVKTSNIIRNSPFPIAVYIGSEMRIEFANQSIMDIWGKGNDVIGKSYFEVLPELAVQAVFSQLDSVFNTGVPFSARNQQIDLVVDGKLQIFYFNYSFTPLRDSSGTIYGVMNTAADVTDVVQAKNLLEHSEEELQAANEELATANEELAATNEELQSTNEELLFSKDELTEANARLNIALEAGSFGSTEVDLATGAMISNKQFKRLFGKTEDEEMTYPEMFEAMLPQYREKIMQQSKFARENHSIYEGTYEIAWPDGSIHWINAHGRAKYDSESNPVKMVGIVSEITESKLNDQRKNDFIGMASHELKTPLTSLTAIIQVANARLKNSPDVFLSGAMEKANTQVKRMSNMINGFLNISRLESGKIHIIKQYFNLDELLREVIKEDTFTVNTHFIHTNICDDLKVYADRDKIHSVITNLLSNAVKYSPKGKNIFVKCEIDGSFARISIKDEGMGIKSADIEKIFDRFYRVETDHTKHISGFGIGLYLSAEIIRHHGGKIWVESDSGKGSTFIFSLPLN